MENNLPEQSPVVPAIENALEGKPIENADSIPNQIPKAPKKFPLFPVLTVLLIVGAFALGYSLNKSSLPITNEESIKNETSPTASVTVAIKKEIKPQLFFVKDPNQDVSDDLQGWLISPNDKKLEKVDLPAFLSAYKYPTSQKIFFTKFAKDGNTDGMLFIKDLTSGEINQFELIKHPNPEAKESIAINTLNSIAPDDSALVYNVSFFKDCPPISIEPGFEGGFGPCEPDPDPNYPAGYYFYDLINKTNTHIDDIVIPAAWDLKNGKFYYTTLEYQKNGLKVIDLKTKQISMVDKAETFGYGGFPLLKSKMIVKIEGQTGDVPGQKSSSELILLNTETKEKKVIDSGRWAEIQPFAAISPDETKFLYIRSKLDSQSRAIYSLYAYDFKTGMTRQVTPVSTTSSYSIHGSWLDDDNFVTTVNETPTSNYNSTKNYLVKINLANDEVTKLTDDSVMRFNQN